MLVKLLKIYNVVQIDFSFMLSQITQTECNNNHNNNNKTQTISFFFSFLFDFFIILFFFLLFQRSTCGKT